MIFTGLEHNDTTILVPSTTNKVLQVVPTNLSLNKESTSSFITKLVKNNELVICFEWKGKKLYSSLKVLKELTPDVRV